MVDALLEAEQTLRLMDKIHSPAEFIHLNDSILDTVSLENAGVRPMLLDAAIDANSDAECIPARMRSSFIETNSDP